jgi:hypothetical protein
MGSWLCCDQRGDYSDSELTGLLNSFGVQRHSSEGQTLSRLKRMGSRMAHPRERVLPGRKRAWRGGPSKKLGVLAEQSKI